MLAKELKGEMAKIIAEHGDWTAHNIHLGQGVFTRGDDRPYRKLLRLVQIAADICEQPLSELRVLDLACLEGGFAIEFAQHGSEVLGIEGREANLAKAQFAKDALGLKRLTFELGDVRNLSPQRHGYFDIVLCAGILYHLKAPDVISLVERIASVCKRLTLIDTSFALRPVESHTHSGREYFGRTFPEHDDSTSQAARLANLWGSLDNTSSFWLTRSSLLNLLKDVGFTSVMEVLNPSLPGQFSDRVVLAAIKGSRCEIHATPSTNDEPFQNWTESDTPRSDPMQRSTYRLEKRLTHLIPASLRRGAKGALRRLGIRKSDSPWNWPSPWKQRRK